MFFENDLTILSEKLNLVNRIFASDLTLFREGSAQMSAEMCVRSARKYRNKIMEKYQEVSKECKSLLLLL